MKTKPPTPLMFVQCPASENASNRVYSECHASKGAKKREQAPTTTPVFLHEALFYPSISTGC